MPSPGASAQNPPQLDYTRVEPVRVLGLPLSPLSMAESLDAVDRMIADGRPNYGVTANLNYAMLTAETPGLAAFNERAALVLADGMPLVWAARHLGRPLPGRVAGSDLVPALCRRAAERGHRVFLLGGAPGIADRAAERLRADNPGLIIAGTACPPFRPLTADETETLMAQIRTSGAHLLFVAIGQPRGELWIAEHLGRMGVPAAFQIGATLDFLAGRVARAPKWVGRVGLEWVFRLVLEPRRLFGRYWRNGWFLIRAAFRGLEDPGRVVGRP